ncbi:MAG TPA: TrbI/VirB10 family protein [Alphaproteobacteria bacterium]|nr:TrbI/VirB10 family protein [Alphaproteobacteria bacterium]
MIQDFSNFKERVLKKWGELPVKAQQKYLLLSGAALVLTTSFGAYALLKEEGKDPVKTQKGLLEETSQTINLSTAKESLNPHLTWKQQMEKEQKDLLKELEEVKKQLKSPKSNHAETSQKSEIDSLKEEMKALKEELLKKDEEDILAKASANFENANLQESASAKHEETGNFQPFANVGTTSPMGMISGVEGAKELPRPLRRGLIKFTTSDKAIKKRKAYSENTVPAGTFAKAVILGGVDASTSVSASNDPRPVLLEVVDKGTLPGKFRSDLKKCHILASSHGDLSSERVMMRLERLSCTEELTGEVLEMQVSGYVAGEDGSTGVRGILVDKAGAQMRNAFIGGFLGGMGEFFSNSMKAQVSMTPLGQVEQFKTMSKTQSLGQSVGKGAHSAFEKIADFYMKRAEQMQPVLQVAAGRIVNIVFTDTANLDGSEVRMAISSSREDQRKQAVSEVSQVQQEWLSQKDSS